MRGKRGWGWGWIVRSRLGGETRREEEKREEDIEKKTSWSSTVDRSRGNKGIIKRKKVHEWEEAKKRKKKKIDDG